MHVATWPGLAMNNLFDVLAGDLGSAFKVPSLMPQFDVIPLGRLVVHSFSTVKLRGGQSHSCRLTSSIHGAASEASIWQCAGVRAEAVESKILQLDPQSLHIFPTGWLCKLTELCLGFT